MCTVSKIVLLLNIEKIHIVFKRFKFIMLKGCVFRPAFGCAHIVYFHQLLGVHLNLLNFVVYLMFQVAHIFLLIPDYPIGSFMCISN